jgi:hypothetical protein
VSTSIPQQKLLSFERSYHNTLKYKGKTSMCFSYSEALAHQREYDRRLVDMSEAWPQKLE